MPLTSYRRPAVIFMHGPCSVAIYVYMPGPHMETTLCCDNWQCTASCYSVAVAYTPCGSGAVQGKQRLFYPPQFTHSGWQSSHLADGTAPNGTHHLFCFLSYHRRTQSCSHCAFTRSDFDIEHPSMEKVSLADTNVFLLQQRGSENTWKMGLSRGGWRSMESDCMG